MSDGIINFNPTTPCRATGPNVCTTALGDDVCKACGRTKEQVDNWLEFSEKKKKQITEDLAKNKIKVFTFPT